MGVRIKDFFRNLATGAGISGRTVSLKRAVDDVEIASTTTGSDGSFTFTDSDTTYRGPVYYGVDDGTRFKEHSGESIGQVGILWIADLLRTLDQLGVGIVNGLAVSGGNGNMNLTVAAGAAILKDGALYGPESSQSVTITAADATNPRIDSVVIRGTRRGETEQGDANLVVIAGTPAGVPTAPALTQNSATWDVWLADVLVDAGVTLIASNKVTDRRTFSVRLTPPVGDSGDILTVENGKWVPKAATSAGATISVSGNGSPLSSAINTLDFSSAFNTTIDPSNEANIGIATNGITAVMLGAGAVTSSKITAGAVGAAAIADGAVTTAKITDANVTDAKIATGISAAKLGAGTVDNTKLGYLSGVTSAIQTQLNAKSATTHYNGDIRTGGAFASPNASTTVYVDLFSESFTLPTGTWTLACSCVANFSNSVGGSGATFRFGLPSTGSATNADTATANNLFMINMAETFTGQSGTITIAGEYRAHTSGTVSAGRWTLTVIATRTA